MKIIYDEEVNQELELAIKKYNYLCNYPIFEIKNVLIYKIRAAISKSTYTPSIFKTFDCELLGRILNEIDYKYVKEYFDEVVWVISGLPFHLDNRFGFVDDNKLYLVITTKGLDKRFSDDHKAIHDWLVRGINYYISSKLTQNMVVGYFSHNHKFFDYDFMFKVFLQFVMIEPDIEKSKRWWEQQGTLFLTFAHNYIQKNGIEFNGNTIQNFITLFNDIVHHYNADYQNIVINPSIGMCFNSGWITDLQVNFDEILPPNILDKLSDSIKNLYDEEILKYIAFTENGEQKSNQYIFIKKDETLENEFVFEIVKFVKGEFVLNILYPTIESLLKLPGVMKKISSVDDTKIVVNFGEDSFNC